jgi:hypothetical protein
MNLKISLTILLEGFLRSGMVMTYSQRYMTRLLALPAVLTSKVITFS